MNVVILTRDIPNQIALCNLIQEKCNVRAIVVSKNIPKKKPSFKKRRKLLVNRIANRTVGSIFVKTWFQVQNRYKKDYSDFPNVPLVKVDNVNNNKTLETLEKYRPDLTIVSSTNLVGKKVIRLSEKYGKGIVNLHTGISPYVKGGPNCTNWCLSERWFHLIGNTIMWLDTGIDSGKIITTEQTPLNGTESLFDLHYKNLIHANELYLRAIDAILQDKKVPSVPQKDIAEGRTFYNVEWDAIAMMRAKSSFEKYYQKHFTDSEIKEKLTSELKLIPLEELNTV